MIIEIRKAGFINKGAELMLRAVYEKLKERYPTATFVMAPSPLNGSQPFRKLVDHGFYPKAWLYLRGVQLGNLAGLVPRIIREMYGIVLDREIDVVIDAAGFSYSDQWGERSTLELANSTKRWRKQGTKVILMPQAFGPYGSDRIRKGIRIAVENSDLVIPRERASLRYLTDVVGERPNIRQYPDFTNLIPGERPDWFDSEVHKVSLVPNYRMVDKTAGAESTAYLPFMTRCAQHLKTRAAKPFILVHEGEKDMWLARQISESCGGIPILRESDPVRIKGILGACHATIGSRFHGLVSALSQGVPALATGWSHKYAELFEDYGFPEWVLSVEDPDRIVNEKIDRIIEENGQSSLRHQLLEKSDQLKMQSEAMWKDVFAVIDGMKRADVSSS